LKKNQKEERQMALEGTEDGEILARLSDRVEKAVGLIQELRRERDELRSRLTRAEERLREQEDELQSASSVRDDYDRFREERSEIRTRIERILDSLESLEAAPAAEE
jgi:FtsZ-binding cell division protein ZapB